LPPVKIVLGIRKKYIYSIHVKVKHRVIEDSFIFVRVFDELKIRNRSVEDEKKENQYVVSTHFKKKPKFDWIRVILARCFATR
jgi:hypothetical protein